MIKKKPKKTAKIKQKKGVSKGAKTGIKGGGIRGNGRPKKEESGGVAAPKIDNQSFKDENGKLNWEVIKLMFFRSTYYHVLPFLKSLEIVPFEDRKASGFIQRKTVGWPDEKKELYRIQTSQIREAFREQAAEFAREVLLPLKEAKTFTINAILERLNQKDAIGPFGHYLKLNDLIAILHMIKVELGEPTDISKTANVNLDLNQLLEYVNESDKPFDRREFEEYIGQERLSALPKIVIDGQVQGADQEQTMAP